MEHGKRRFSVGIEEIQLEKEKKGHFSLNQRTKIGLGLKEIRMDPKGKQELRRLRCIKKAKLNLYVKSSRKEK